MLGNTCRPRIRRRLPPFIIAAVTYSLCLTLNVGPRATLEKAGNVTTMMVTTTLGVPVPMTAETKIAINSIGKAKAMSINRMTIWSAIPPRYPTTMPRSVPATAAMAAHNTASPREYRNATTSRANILLPRRSVPIGNSKDGAANVAVACISCGSPVPTKGPTIEKNTAANKNSAATEAVLFRRANLDQIHKRRGIVDRMRFAVATVRPTRGNEYGDPDMRRSCLL